MAHGNCWVAKPLTPTHNDSSLVVEDIEGDGVKEDASVVFPLAFGSLQHSYTIATHKTSRTSLASSSGTQLVGPTSLCRDENEVALRGLRGSFFSNASSQSRSEVQLRGSSVSSSSSNSHGEAQGRASFISNSSLQSVPAPADYVGSVCHGADQFDVLDDEAEYAVSEERIRDNFISDASSTSHADVQSFPARAEGPFDEVDSLDGKASNDEGLYLEAGNARPIEQRATDVCDEDRLEEFSDEPINCGEANSDNRARFEPDPDIDNFDMYEELSFLHTQRCRSAINTPKEADEDGERTDSDHEGEDEASQGFEAELKAGRAEEEARRPSRLAPRLSLSLLPMPRVPGRLRVSIRSQTSVFTLHSAAHSEAEDAAAEEPSNVRRGPRKSIMQLLPKVGSFWNGHHEGDGSEEEPEDDDVVGDMEQLPHPHRHAHPMNVVPDDDLIGNRRGSQASMASIDNLQQMQSSRMRVGSIFSNRSSVFSHRSSLFSQRSSIFSRASLFSVRSRVSVVSKQSATSQSSLRSARSDHSGGARSDARSDVSRGSPTSRPSSRSTNVSQRVFPMSLEEDSAYGSRPPSSLHSLQESCSEALNSREYVQHLFDITQASPAASSHGKGPDLEDVIQQAEAALHMLSRAQEVQEVSESMSMAEPGSGSGWGYRQGNGSSSALCARSLQ